MFNKSTLDAFCDHVREMRRADATERRAKKARKAAEREARLDALERQTISVWRIQGGHPVEIIHQR